MAGKDASGGASALPGGEDALRTLAYSEALLNLTLRQNSEAMTALARIFTEVGELLQAMETGCAAPADSVGADSAAMQRYCQRALAKLRRGLTTLQMHDVTEQRLSHVLALLNAVGHGVAVDIESVLTEAEELALLQRMARNEPLVER